MAKNKIAIVGGIIVLVGLLMFPASTLSHDSAPTSTTVTGVVIKQYEVEVKAQATYSTSVTITGENDTLKIGSGSGSRTVTFDQKTYPTLQAWQAQVNSKLSGQQITASLVSSGTGTAPPSVRVSFESKSANQPGSIGMSGTTCWAPLGLAQGQPVTFVQSTPCTKNSDCPETDVCLNQECQTIGKCNTPANCEKAVEDVEDKPSTTCDSNQCKRTDASSSSSASGTWIATAPMPVYQAGTGGATKQRMVQYMYGMPGTPNVIADTITVTATTNAITVTKIQNPGLNGEKAEATQAAFTIPAKTYTPAELEKAVNAAMSENKTGVTMTHVCRSGTWNARRQTCQGAAGAPTPAPATLGPAVSTTEGVISYTPMFVHTKTEDDSTQKIMIGGTMRAPLGRGANTSQETVPLGTPCPTKGPCTVSAERMIQVAESDNSALSIYTASENDAVTKARQTNPALAFTPNQVNAPYASMSSGAGACGSTSTSDISGLAATQNTSPSSSTCNVFSSPIHPDDPGSKSKWEKAPAAGNAVYNPGDFITLYFAQGENAPPSSFNPQAAEPPVSEGNSTLILVGIILISLGVVIIIAGLVKASKPDPQAPPATPAPPQAPPAAADQ